MLIGPAVVLAVRPAVSVTEPATLWPSPSCSRITGAGHGPASGALPATQLNVTVTGVRYQPAVGGAGS